MGRAPKRQPIANIPPNSLRRKPAASVRYSLSPFPVSVGAHKTYQWVFFVEELKAPLSVAAPGTQVRGCSLISHLSGRHKCCYKRSSEAFSKATMVSSYSFQSRRHMRRPLQVVHVDQVVVVFLTSLIWVVFSESSFTNNLDRSGAFTTTISRVTARRRPRPCREQCSRSSVRAAGRPVRKPPERSP